MPAHQTKQQLPPSPTLPRTVQTARWMLDGPRFLEACQARLGNMFTLELVPRVVGGPGAGGGTSRWVFISDPALLKRAFTTDPSQLRTGSTNRFLLPLVGPDSILVLDEPRHMEQRKIMLPAFHGKRIQRYAELMEQTAMREIERWPFGRPLAVWPGMQRITLEVIVRAVFGISEPSEVDRFQRLLAQMLNDMTSARFLISSGIQAALSRRDGTDLTDGSRWVRRLLDPVEAAIAEEIRSRRADRQLADREDILSALMCAHLEDGSPLSDRELRDELITLLIAGHESTATMLAWAFERLVRHPQKLERLRDEALSGGREYADAVVQETLRLRPVIPFVLRKLAAPMELGGYELPARTWLAPCAYLVHRNPDIYPQPRAFCPERFLDKAPDTYAWTPFGGGVRRCVGAAFAQLEMRVVLQAVVTQLDLRAADKRPERIRRRFITLAPSRHGRVVVTRRRTAVRVQPHRMLTAP